MKKFVCTVCGYIHEGENAPEICPLCKVGADKFIEQSDNLVFADEHRIGVAKGVDSRIIEGLQANFMGECTEVGMYLAMARQADREGFPEVARSYTRIAFEEAEHAAKFAEMLGEVVEADTKANLQARVNAEHGACQGKKDLATLAKQLNLDAIHDTVHEMCKDEARHGKAFSGLLERYFSAEEGNDFDYHNFELTKKVKENDVVTSFYFKPLAGAAVKTHKAGQFLSVKPVKEGKLTEEVRQYSLSMKPGEDFYRLSIKREDQGKISRYMHDNVNVGDVVELTSPLGEFFLKEDKKQPLVLLSGGIGVTPVMSMLYKALEEKREVIFVQAVLNSTAHTFKNELKALADANSNLKTAVFYSNPTADEKIGVDYDVEGFATKEWLEANLPKNGEFYFCGPLGFMKHVFNTLKGMDVADDSINYEMFGPAADLSTL